MTEPSLRTPLWILATAAIIVGLHWFADVLTQFALALILFLAIDGLARFLAGRAPFLPRWLILPVALLTTVGLVVLIGYVVTQNVSDLTLGASGYERRLNELAAQVHALFGLSGPAPTVGGVLAQVGPSQIVQRIVEGLRGLASDVVFILIYLGFLFAAAASFPAKLDAIFPDHAARERARAVLTRIRVSMERYLLVQTVVSLVITGLTYATLLVIGLDNALFWAFLIFFLNYIPTIGSLVAVVLPTAFALVQFPTIGPVIAVAGGVGAWQFVIGNFVQPRMTGESLNLSTLVVLLALAVWGSIWGIAGAFLAAPLTVMVMIVLAQFASTRWIAVLLSADGDPVGGPDANAPKAKAAP